MNVRFFLLTLPTISLMTGCQPTPDSAPQTTAEAAEHRVAIAIHGGAGNLRKMALTPEQEAAYLAAMEEALRAGYAVLQEGRSSVDAVEATVRILEDCPLFNAGKGAVFNHEGINEMDAAIMNGADLSCGAVTGLRTIRNPITAARLVMEQSEHVFLSGRGAEEFAAAQGAEVVDPGYFYTDHRWAQWQEALAEDSVALDHSGKKVQAFNSGDTQEKFGTVGCVALDSRGNLAAATSTGGLTNKKFGRIGDSPLIGCGTYANNHSCAVSCTGRGEDFIRHTVAADIAAECQYLGVPLDTATHHVIINKLKAAKGRGGCIAMDPRGNVSAKFTTSGMFRGWIDTDGKITVRLYEEPGETESVR